jgi:hypothetical protein
MGTTPRAFFAPKTTMGRTLGKSLFLVSAIELGTSALWFEVRGILDYLTSGAGNVMGRAIAAEDVRQRGNKPAWLPVQWLHLLADLHLH